MLRNVFFILFSLFTCAGLFAQEVAPTNIYTKQFGFDASVLVNRFLNFSGNNPQSSPYQITYRKYGTTSNQRYGLGFVFGVEVGDLDPSARTAVVFRFGKERFKQFGKPLPSNSGISRWRAFYGWDWKTELAVQHRGATDDTTLSVAFGPSPFFGLAFQLNERLSISTEMAYDLTMTYSRISEQNIFRFRGEFIPPLALYLGYDF